MRKSRWPSGRGGYFGTARRLSAAAVFAAAALAFAGQRTGAADPQPYTVDFGKTGNGAIDQALHDASTLVSLEKTAPVGPFALIERARTDGGRFTDVLQSFGYYKGEVDITIAGHGIAETNLPDLLSRAP